MTTLDIIQIILYIFVLTALTPVLGHYMFRIFGEKSLVKIPLLTWLEKIYF